MVTHFQVLCHHRYTPSGSMLPCLHTFRFYVIMVTYLNILCYHGYIPSGPMLPWLHTFRFYVTMVMVTYLQVLCYHGYLPSGFSSHMNSMALLRPTNCKTNISLHVTFFIHLSTSSYFLNRKKNRQAVSIRSYT